MKAFVRWIWFQIFLGRYEWYRKLYGGKWMYAHFDCPVNSTLWIPVPDDATPDYREPLMRGTPWFKNYDL